MALEDRAQESTSGVRLILRGSVQGVGFRPFAWQIAHRLGIRGSVRNANGGAIVDAFGSPKSLSSFLDALESPALPGARVEATERHPLATAAPPGFEIVESASPTEQDSRELALATDLPTCEPCLEELADPESRRHRYPFIACAHCGPRFTMARNLPYDRQRTSMADFPLCTACAAEYHSPSDRRHHAEATCCAACGPALGFITPTGETIAEGEFALAQAVAMLRCSGVVAVRGIGGYHLACDATDEHAIRRLRDFKRRDRKPLAVMVASLAEADALAQLTDDERALLDSEARPITLTRRRPESPLAPSVAPDSPIVGLLLAYTPLHALLLADFGGPLVMTSANRSSEPIAYRAEEALGRLADAVLDHDREIVAPCDDSVAIPAASGPILLRRSRGHVPRPIRLEKELQHTVLACGGQWSNAICVASGDHAWLSAHVGDIESPDCISRMEETTLRLLDQLGAKPDLIAHDLHPGYESTRFAKTWPQGGQVIGVQHHHAHLASVLGEHDVAGTALGLVWDGTGYGDDGSAWGGELIYCGDGDLGDLRRLATFRPIPLAGGERAIREPWRLALALLDDAFEGHPPLSQLELFQHVDPRALELVPSLLASPELCPLSHGVGRYFDAVGALLLARPSATFQGELAIGLNALARAAAAAYPFDLDCNDEPWQIDLRPAIRELVGDLCCGAAPSAIADRFHGTLIAAGDRVVREALERTSTDSRQTSGDVPTVALGGGCFQNPILLDGLERRLGADVRVVRPRRLPPGDGGLALGQALIADAIATKAGRAGQAGRS